jgi:hypothetical protein
VRRAIALGRLALDPLAVLAQLSGGVEGSGREVLSIHLTDIQELLSTDERMAVVEQVRGGGMWESVTGAAASTARERATPWEFSGGSGAHA